MRGRTADGRGPIQGIGGGQETGVAGDESDVVSSVWDRGLQ